MHLPSILTLSSIATLGLVACGAPPEPTAVRSRISKDLGHVLTETTAASQGATATLPGGSTLSLLAKAWGIGGGAVSTPVPPPGSGVLPARAGLLALTNPANQIDPDAIIAELNDKLFTNANSLGDGVYQVPAELVCSSTSTDSQGNPITTVDPACAQQLAQAEVRVRVGDDASTLQFFLQVDHDHDEPLAFELSHDSLAMTIDLDNAARATTALSAVFGQQAPNVRLAGAVTARLDILGAAHVSASLTIDHALDIAFADMGAALDGPTAFRLTSAAAKVAAVELDGTAQIGSLELGLGATRVHVPGTDEIDLDLGGATAKAELAPGQPLHLTNLGLGDHTTTMAKNGVQAIAIDLNPTDGRKLDATITADAATGTETLSVTPKLDLRLAIDHAALGDAPSVYDVTRVLVDGSVRGSDASDQIEVVTGMFAITTSPTAYGFSAAGGQCVSGQDTLDAGSGTYYTRWTVGGCI